MVARSGELVPAERRHDRRIGTTLSHRPRLDRAAGSVQDPQSVPETIEMTNRLTRRSMLAAALAVAAAALAPAAIAKEASKEKNQAEVRKMAQDTLDRLFKLQPGARTAVQNAAGYAVFSNFGMKIFFAGGGTGSGLAVDNKAKTESFMKMVEVQAGLGLGVKKFRLIWVFENAADLNAFVNSGWELGAQTTAAAKKGEKGEAFAGAISIKPGVWLYQITDEGLALELTAKGTKYYKDADLN
jgi:lipid-binding SYLF domain-containing protein